MSEDWNKKATGILKSILTRRNIQYPELATKLNAIGLDETQSSIASKISRGTFSFVFFIQCMKVLNVEEIKID